MNPYYTERMLHEEAAGMGLEDAFFKYNRIFPVDEPVARWELTEINPLRIDLFAVGRKKQAIATVYHTATWFTWDEDGIGGENGSGEESIDVAMNEAIKACLRQGYL